MAITAEDLEAANAYLQSKEATPDGIRKVRRYLDLAWAEYIEQDHTLWRHELFPAYAKGEAAPHHDAFWDHIDSIKPGVKPPAYVTVWSRGHAKSTNIEMACVRLAQRKTRRYGLYLSGIQDKADDHVGNVQGMMESSQVEKYYPDLALPLKGKFGNSKGWRRNRIRTASGYTLDALGLDVAARGVKLDDQRPDHIILDDIDGSRDTLDTVAKKIKTITEDLLPAGSEDLAVFGAQNLIHRNGIFTRIVDGRADFLKNRIVSGPIPALRGFTYGVNEDNVFVITGGEPTWDWFTVERCQDLLNDIGPRAFKSECLHDVYEVVGALWRQGWIDDFRELHRKYEALDPIKTVVGVDPAVTDNEDSDETGIVVGCKSRLDKHDYILADRSCRVSPYEWAKRVIKAYDDFNADLIVAENNQGGLLVKRNIEAAAPGRNLPIKLVNVRHGKELRAQPVATLYERGLVHHMAQLMYLTDSLEVLEDQQTSWVPGHGDSPDHVDALTIVETELSIGAPGVTQQPVVDTRMRNRR